jgi:uncharacterized membrane protein
MDDVAVALAIHVLAVVVWIGGVALVTTAVLPALRHGVADGDRLALFEAIERRFVWQARIAVILVAISGLYLIEKLHLWQRFRMPGFWWMHAMVCLWALFALILFVGEPLVLHRWIQRKSAEDSDQAFLFLNRLHWVLLVLSLIVVCAAVAGSNGFDF